MPSLSSLESWLRRPAEWLFELGRSVDPSLRVTSARRSYQEQARLFDDYIVKLRRGLPTLPAAPPGRSMHQYGRAFDLARPSVPAYQDQLLAELGAVWNEIGGTWSETDPVHFEA